MSSASSVRSGELTQRIQFQRNAGTRVGGGSTDAIWVPLGNTVACKITPLSGGKQFLAMQAQSRVTHEIEMRYRGDVGPHYRIKWGDSILEIDRIINVESRNRKLLIMAVLVT